MVKFGRTLREVFETIKKEGKEVRLSLLIEQGAVTQTFTSQICYVGDDFVELHQAKVIVPVWPSHSST